MIRIYLDWNVISDLKRPEFQEMFNFIKENKDAFLFPYSPAHFTDLMKSYFPENKLFFQDLDNLEFLAGKHFMRWEGEGAVKPLFCTPREYFESQKNQEDPLDYFNFENLITELNDPALNLENSSIGDLLRSVYQIQPLGFEVSPDNQEAVKKFIPNIHPNSNKWDLMKDVGTFIQLILKDRNFLKDLRNTLKDGGYKIDVNSGNWNYHEVVPKIDDFLQDKGLSLDFIEFTKKALEHKNGQITWYELFTTSYLMLDILGYKMDKLPKPTDNFQNIQADAEHSFYGGHCDFLVASDTNLKAKSKVLFDKFNVSTIIIDPKDFIQTINKYIHKINPEIHFIKETCAFCNVENCLEYFPITNDRSYEVYSYKLPTFYFNYFTHLILSRYPDQDVLVFTYRRAFSNLSRWIYYTEAEAVIERIALFFGRENQSGYESKKQAIVNSENSDQASISWSFDQGIITIESEEDTKRPILNYYVSVKETEV